MNELIALFGLLALIAAALANIGIWSPRAVWVKAIAVLMLALFLPVTYSALTELMSRPKPVHMEWINQTVPEAVVLGSRIVEDEAIYIWLAFEGQGEPRAYELPWSQKLAKQLHKAHREAKAGNGSVMMRRPFKPEQRSIGERVFYSAPREALPQKQTAQRAEPLVFNRREQAPVANN